MTLKLHSQTAAMFVDGDVEIWPRAKTPQGDLFEVFSNLRKDDLFELSCLGSTPDEALRLALFASHSYVVRKAGEPVFVGGVHQIFPHCFVVFGFGTEETRKVLRVVTRYIRNHWLPDMFEKGAKRFEVRVPTRSPSVRWLEAIGFRFETDLPGYAASDEPHQQLSITRTDHVLV